MIKEALQYIVGIAEPKIHEIFGLPHTDRSVKVIEPPEADEVRVETLAALVSLVQMPLDSLDPNEVYAQVLSPLTVSLVSKKADDYGRRHQFAAASTTDCKFQFANFHDPEGFIIGLQCHFVEDQEMKKLMTLCSSLTAENVSIAEDDGISQTATVRQGIALKNRAKIDAKVRLRPYRTFREVDQPPSQFLFRLRNRDNMPPSCALFEADGGAWRIEAVENVAEWLTDYLPKTVKVVF